MANQKQKMYVLGMFPYPSGAGLHVGHVRIYTACDVMARYFKAKGYEVLHPMGWDAFGLPAENAAIKFKTNPMQMVPKNEANFKKQLRNLEMSFDWSREFSTTDPNYYGITQWLFLKLYEKGLVYRDKVPINWCPKCKTGIANEEVLGDGSHERCGTVVERREMWQWVMRITEYAERLLADLDKELAEFGGKTLDWPRGILEMQRNWIGKKEGAKVKFRIEGLGKKETVEVFTTRLDTIFGVTFVVVAPELAKKWLEAGWQASRQVREYVERALRRTERARMAGEREKTGVETGLRAVNPMNGEKVPIWVADYVLARVGTGAVMGVPAHDERDWQFAKKHGLKMKVVVKRKGEEVKEEMKEAFTDDGVVVASGKYTGMTSKEAREAMRVDLEKRGLGEKEVHYHLRDWVFSRQRYWGEPMPLVYCRHCAKKGDFQVVERKGEKWAVVPLREKDLPLELPYLASYEPTDTGESPLARVQDWVKTKCPVCGGEAERETDTMPNWAGSCWYFLAFPFWKKGIEKVLEEYKKKYPEEAYSRFWQEVAKPAIDKWMPVDWYLGGAEHAVLHLLYARFWVKVFKDMGLVDFEEPFLRLRSVGIVLAEDGRKMSKSWGNVVNPDEVVKEYGADAVRMYEMFMGPWDQSIAWDTRSLVGQKRFLERVRKIFGDKKKEGEKTSRRLQSQLYRLLHQVERGILSQKFNTAIAGMMELVNRWEEEGMVMSREDKKRLVIMLAPFAPGLAGELWAKEGFEGKVEEARWPKVEEIEDEEMRVAMVVQVNGRKRAVMEVAKGVAEDKEAVMKRVLAEERVKKWLPREVKKVVFVPGKLVNVVGSD